MPHVSKHKVEKGLLQKLFAELEKLIAQTTAKESSLVLATLLTHTGRIMLTKRLAAALMFSEGLSPYEVWNTLKISPSTAQRLHLAYQRKEYDPLVTIVKRSPHEKIWDTLDLILRAGMPPRGKDRWKVFNSQFKS